LHEDEGGEYVEAVIKEALRLHPPIAFVDRKLTAELEIAGRRLAAGTIVAPCIYLAHRRPDLYTPSPMPSALNASSTSRQRRTAGCPSAEACAVASARASPPSR
jgi:hypothetical protein